MSWFRMLVPGLSGRGAVGRSVVFGGGLAVVGGMGAGLLVAATARGGPYWSDGLLLCAYLLAAVSISALLGLVFAVPRARAGAEGDGPERFVPNSNLEQISDWLTKILVGAGLVQLGALPGSLRSLGDYLGTDMRVAGAQAASVSLVVYGSGVGFVFAYLWGRLRLRVLLEASERDAAEQARRQVLVATSLAAASQRTGDSESATSIADAAAKATAAVTRSTSRDLLPVLWVDDHPENNVQERHALDALGITTQQATSTAQALTLLENNRYGVVITDLGRDEDGVRKDDAGLELIQQLRARGDTTPIVVYAGMRAFARGNELRAAGATQVFNRATDLVSFVAQTLA